MRIYVVFLMVVAATRITAQVTDDFLDGDFTNNPTWSGNDSKFIIENGQLKSNSTLTNDIFYLTTPNTKCTDAEWRFTINMKFATSSANFTDFILLCDNANPNIATSGYLLRVGNTKDEISLYRLETGGPFLILDGTDGTTENKVINIKVLRTAAGEWSVYTDNTGNKNYTLEGSVLDNTYTTCTHFGIQIKQSTATFFQKHFIDDIYIGPIYVDTKAPAVTEAKIVTPNRAQVSFDELPASYSTADFLVSKAGNPSSIVVSGNSLLLNLDSTLEKGYYTLGITNVKDAAGNKLDTSILLYYSNNGVPRYGDLYVTEIFADPSPIIGLPDAEFIELYNASDDTLNLNGSKLSDATTTATLLPYNMPPKSYVILSKTGLESTFAPFGAYLGVPSFPSLNNASDNVVLRTASGILLDSIKYTDKWYRDDVAKNGGYSLELIEKYNNCETSINWKASTDARGGTPGRVNSYQGVNPDQEAPELISTLISGTNTLLVTFNEPVYGLTTFMLNEFGENPSTLTQIPNTFSYTLGFLQSFLPSTTYNFSIASLNDCLGNMQLAYGGKIINPVEAEPGDIILNELLFNPKTNGVDFIEIYNTSDKTITLNNLILARYSTLRADLKPLTSTGQIIDPKQYMAFTTSKNQTLLDYPEAVALNELSSLPPMNNDNGIVLLLNETGTLLDSVTYSEKQHFELLSDLNGISLERVHFGGQSYNPMMWHSASVSVGGATPGYVNSQFVDITPSTANYSLQHNILSPDADGYQDLLILNYQAQNLGFALQGYVFDLSGRLVHHVWNNELLAAEGSLSWDGILENGTKTPIGNYVLLIEALDLNGKTDRKKMAFSVVGRF
jgi:hypothetical protein